MADYRLIGRTDALYGPLDSIYSIAFCSRPEEASYVISINFIGPIVPDKCMKFRDPRLNRSREILPEAVGGDIFDVFFRDNFRPEVVRDVISGMDAE